MKKIIFLPLILLINSFLFAQNTIILDENFNSSNSDWIRNSLSEDFSKVENGNFKIRSSSNDALRLFSSQILIDYTRDFYIETRIKQTLGDKNLGHGIIWGSRGWGNSFFFMISSSGYFIIAEYENEEYKKIVMWRKSDAIKPYNYNILKIAKTDNNLNFFINNKNVYTTKFQKFHGQFHGNILQSNLTCLVDYIKIANDKRKIKIANHEIKGQKKNIGRNVNSSYTDIAPIISADGKTLYFARGGHPGNYKGTSDEADIWYSKLQDDGTWSVAKNIGKPLNNSGVNVVVNVTADGNTLFLEGLYNSDGSFKSDQGISVSHRTNSGWSIPKQVKVDNFYNNNIYETYFFTSNQKVLIMSIERDDTYGYKDLYISFRKSDGSYSSPKNMGTVLNTIGDEGTPFMSPDNRTLYYSTDGLNGYGSNDIYVTKRLDDTWLNWSQPENLGTAINTVNWDTYLSVSAKGDKAFLVSSESLYGDENIYIIESENENLSDPVVIVRGKVIDAKSHIPIGAKITYHDLSNGKELGIAQSDPRTGNYQIVLPYGKLYDFRAEAKNYIAQNENIDLRQTSNYNEITRNLKLIKIQIDEIITLNNIFFRRASHELDNTSYPELDRIVKILKDNKTMVIELRGHTDNIGNPEVLMELSEKRINEVKKYLVSKGINSDRIKTKAFGGTKTINKNNSQQERRKNRRVEFKILKK